jgi:hypothetical protein
VGRLNAEEMTRNPNLLLIDTELTIPNPQRWNTNWNVHSINFRKLDEFDERVLTLEPTILVSKYEIDNPEEIYTSLQWRKFLLRLASVKDTKLVSAFSSVNKRNVSTAYLALLHTSSTTIVAS